MAAFDLVALFSFGFSNPPFLSSLVQLNPSLFKENCDIGKYHIRSLISF